MEDSLKVITVEEVPDDLAGKELHRILNCEPMARANLCLDMCS
eukprot:SAG11_NODE_5542_length_1531_cov_1.185754_1_plen_43_part_00